MMTTPVVKTMIDEESAAKTTRGFLPEHDGVTHINIHPSPKTARTRLGQDLSSFKYMPFLHPYYGNFCSMEGFRYYLGNKERDDKLRHYAHERAYRYGKRGTPDPYKEHQDDIMAGVYQKILQNQKLCKMVVDSFLPFDMYYRFGPGLVIISPKESNWFIPELEDIRKCLKAGVVPDVWTRSEERYDRGELRR